MMILDGTTDQWSYKGLKTVIMENESMIAIFLPDLGGILWRLVEKRTGKDLLYMHRDPSLYGKMISSYSKRDPIHDHFIGGWFEALPVAGYGFRGNKLMPELDLHGETPYRSWDHFVDEGGDLHMSIDLIRMPLKLKKTISLNGRELRFKEKLTNLGSVGLDYSWLHHPCFDLEVFDDAKIELDAAEIETDSLFVHPYRKFEPGYKGKWPIVKGKSGLEYNLSRVLNEKSENYTDTVYLKPEVGHYSILKKGGPGLKVNYDRKVFQSLWYWIANGGGAYPWFGRARTFSLEISTSFPASGLDDQIDNGTSSRIEGGDEIKTEIRVNLEYG